MAIEIKEFIGDGNIEKVKGKTKKNVPENEKTAAKKKKSIKEKK